ncbi:unnamed protein product [Closterium sp. Yama58-4]|nr:unnamed protein product [Closterium sp. Yama58-4]CAI5476222.1 unnamed protein product [Closterium sp. Yama58-4]
MEPISAADKSAPTSADFPLRVQMGRGLSFTLEWNDYAVLRDQKKEFTERCFGLAIRFAWFDIGRDDLRLWVLGIGPLRSAMKAADHSCFAKAFDADIAAIPLKSTGGPLPGSHCSVIAILYPGDVLKAEGQVCRTSIRHIDPHTGKGKHRDEAVRVLKLFRTAALAELGRPGRKWDGAPPSQAVVEERLADCDDPIRDKVPGTVSDGHVGTGMLAATSFGWVAKQIGLLTGDKARSAVSIENIKVAGLRSLRDSMVDYICHRVAENRIAAPTSGADGPAEGAIDDDGAESQTAPQAAAAAQLQEDLPVSAEGGTGGGLGDDAAGAGRKEEELTDSGSESESEGEEEDEGEKENEDEEDDEGKDENDEVVEVVAGKDEAAHEEGVEEEVEYELEYADGTVEAVGSADEKNEEAEDGDAGNATGSAGEGKEKDEVGVEATTETGQEEAACEGAKVSVDAGEGANIAGVQETGDASGRQGPATDDVEELRRENLLLRAENARLQGLLDAERARLDAFFVGLRGLVDHLKELAEQVDDTEKYAAEQLRNAAEAMSQTITGNITGSFDEAWKTMKTFAEQASAWLEDFDNPEGNVAYQRALAVTTLADHVDKVVGDAQEDLREHITSQLSAAAVNIATAVTGRLPVQPPPPPQPTPPALPEELLKSFKADIMKTVTEATEQSFVASGMKMLTEMIGTVAPGRRGSSPSANDADAAQQRAADKQGLKRSGDGDDKESSKRSKGSDGSRVTKPPARSVVDMLKAKGWKVRGGSTSKGSGSGGADGRPADGIAANVDAPPGPPLDAEQTHPQASGGKDAAPTAQAAKVGGAGTTQGPSDAVPAKGKAMSASATVAGTGTAKAASASVPGTGKSKAASATVAGTTKSKAASGTVAGTTKSTPCNPPAATTGPAGQTGAGKHGEARAAPPAPAAPTAAKVDAKAASAQGPPGSNALRVLLHRMESHRPGAQQHHVVDAGLAEIARRSVTPHVAGKPSDAQSAARPVAAPPPADPKSAFLRAHIGARKAAAPPVTQPEPGTSATPTAVNATASSPGAAVVDLAAERGVSAALATGGRADRHAALESVLAQFEAAKRPEHAPALAIVDTAHAEPSATNTGGSAEPTAATGVVAEENAGRKGKDDTGKGKAVSAGKEMAEDKGKKPARKTGGKGKSAKKKEEEEKEEEEEEEVGEGEEHGRRGHGIRRDRSGDGQGWVGEMKFKNQNRYIGKSRDKMELAYEHAIAYSVYDGYVSKVLMKELTALKPGELDEWKAVWEEVKILPTGMWTVMWARGLCHPRARFDDILGRFRGYAGSGDALHGVLWPAMWFPIIEDTEEGRAETNANMSAMVNRVSMCAAYGKVAARVAYGKVDGSAEATAGETTDMEGADRKADEKVQMGAQALAASACALWCYMSTPASVLGAVGEGKAAAILAGAGKERGEHFAMVMHVVIEHARTRQAPAGEVAHNVAPELQRYGVARAFEAGIEEDEADMIARATVETLAFWGMCPLDGPKLKAEGIDVPCDAKMEYDLDHRGRKGEKVKQAKGSKRKR